jgi:hypothetical protein
MVTGVYVCFGLGMCFFSGAYLRKPQGKIASGFYIHLNFLKAPLRVTLDVPSRLWF